MAVQASEPASTLLESCSSKEPGSIWCMCPIAVVPSSFKICWWVPSRSVSAHLQRFPDSSPRANCGCSPSPNRFPDLPNLPTIDEIVPGVITNTWYGLFVPAGTPEAIVERLNHAMNVALKDAKVVSNFKLQGMLPAGGTPAEFAKLVRDDLEHWGKVIPSIGLKPQ